MTSRSGLLLLGTAILLALGGCAAHAVPVPVAGTCLGTGTQSASPAATQAGTRVPDVRLACLDGSGDVQLDTFDRPTVISLWASWCAPCRTELPGLAGFAKSTSGRVQVIGVDTGDTRTGAQSMVSDLGLSYPMLFDPDSRLSTAVGRKVLPVTLFVRAGGTIAYLYDGAKPLDQPAIADLVARYLGVPVGR